MLNTHKDISRANPALGISETEQVEDHTFSTSLVPHLRHALVSCHAPANRLLVYTQDQKAFK